MKAKSQNGLLGALFPAFSQLNSSTSFEKPSSSSSCETLKTFMLHVGLLIKKNVTLQKRSLRTTLVQYWAPLMACYTIFLLQGLQDNITSGVQLETPIDTIGRIPRCYGTDANPDDCVSIAYATVGPSEPWIQSVMDYVAKANDFDSEKDINYLGEINPKEFGNYLNGNANKTQIGVLFCTEEWKIENGPTIPCRPESVTDKKIVFYSVIFNMTAFVAPIGDDFRLGHPKHDIASSLKLWLDNGIVAYFSQDKEATGDQYIELDPADESLPKMELKTQGFPKAHFRFVIGADLVSSLGTLMFFLPFMIHFVITIMDIMKEKHNKLRQGLSVMGMSDSAYWTSWGITSVTANFMLTAATLFSGYFFGYKLFTDTPIPILFSMFFSLGLALQAVAFFITTLCPTMIAAYVITYAVILLFVLLTLIMGNAVLSYLVFAVEIPSWFVPINFMFRFIPIFNYTGIYSQITTRSGGHYDMDNNYWVQGPGFTYNDLWASYSDEKKEEFEIPCAMYFFKELAFNTCLYLILAWYCDNVVSHNRGCEKPLLFFLQGWNLKNPFSRFMNQRSYKKKSADFTDSYRDEHTDLASPHYQQHLEAMSIHQPLQEGNGLRIIGLNKIYAKYSLGCLRKKEMHAVKDLRLDIDDGELLSILGHNGAGKTTTIGVLTGILKPTSGTARICDYDIRNEMDSIRRIMGVCPQFDILWDELTAEEHLQIYARLKGIHHTNVPKEIETRLREVNLLHVRHAQAGTFSGGMKRRLSMAIAFIGDPRIVFLDEPTTGMDPKNRRYIWELILNMKRNKIVVLTTHAMEEADVLSDRIAIMAGGSLKCIGTPLYLKNTYGDGYKLSVVVEKDDIEDVKEDLSGIIPSGKILDCSGGSLMIGVPLAKNDELQSFFGIMEGKESTEQAKRLRSKVKDWGLSNTTLEEVFMKVTRE